MVPLLSPPTDIGKYKAELVAAIPSLPKELEPVPAIVEMIPVLLTKRTR